MSRIGNAPIEVPAGVTVDIKDQAVKVTGPKGSLELNLPKGITVKLEDTTLKASRSNDEKANKAKHGLVRSLLNNMIEGTTEGYKKELEVNGVGFKVNLAGKTLKLALGYSHEIEYTAAEGIDLAVDGNVITVTGIDKQLVGQTAADIRALRKPEPYKGKGIQYVGEQILRKSGKSAAGAEGA